jgi:hypothetical protein
MISSTVWRLFIDYDPFRTDNSLVGIDEIRSESLGQKKVSVSIRGFVTIRSLTQVAFRNMKFAKSLCWDLLFYVDLCGSAVGVDYNVNALL